MKAMLNRATEMGAGYVLKKATELRAHGYAVAWNADDPWRLEVDCRAGERRLSGHVVSCNAAAPYCIDGGIVVELRITSEDVDESKRVRNNYVRGPDINNIGDDDRVRALCDAIVENTTRNGVVQ